MRLVWENELGGRTYAVGSRYLKVGRSDLRPEAERMRWAGAYTPVPRVVDVGFAAGESWLLTEALPGTNAVEARWKAAPEVAVRAIAQGLRSLHDALPVAECPFSWRAADRLAVSFEMSHDPSRWHSDHQSLSAADALAVLREPPDEADVVVCHGDTCAPNTLIGDDGRWTGHVDLGALGVADRWADLAVATWSTTWNYGPGWERPLLEWYGAEPDEERTRYYRLLWDLSP